MHEDRPPALTTPSSVRSDHVRACAAYIIGWPILWVMITAVGFFDFIYNSIDLSDYSIFDHWVLSARLPDGLSHDLKVFLNACHVGTPACAVGKFAEIFTALAIVGMGVVPKLIEGPTFAAPVHRRSSRFLHFVLCLALVVIVGRYVVGPLQSLVFGSSGLSYGEKWKFLPGSMLAWHLGEFVAACLATRHSIRIRGGWQAPSAFFATVLAGDAQAVAEHLSSGVDPNAVRHADGATALQSQHAPVNPTSWPRCWQTGQRRRCATTPAPHPFISRQPPATSLRSTPCSTPAPIRTPTTAMHGLR